MSKKLGLAIKELNKDFIQLLRKTRESEIDLTLEKSEKLEFKINSGIEFLNHMLEHVVWRSGWNIFLEYKTTQFSLSHVIWEDVGIVLGRAVRELMLQNMEEGVEGKGDAVNCIDEALALVVISIEGRSNCFLDFQEMPGAKIELVEDAKSWDIRQFFDGFAQGSRATIHIKGLSGEDPHHVWEAIFRAFGEALGNVFNENKLRKGLISGVKGVFD